MLGVRILYSLLDRRGRLQGDRYERAEVKDQRLSLTNSTAIGAATFRSPGPPATSTAKMCGTRRAGYLLSPQEDASYLFYTSAICSLFVVSGVEVAKILRVSTSSAELRTVLPGDALVSACFHKLRCQGNWLLRDTLVIPYPV